MHLVAAGAKVVVADLDEVGPRRWPARSTRSSAAQGHSASAPTSRPKNRRDPWYRRSSPSSNGSTCSPTTRAAIRMCLSTTSIYDSWRRVVTLNLRACSLHQGRPARDARAARWCHRQCHHQSRLLRAAEHGALHRREIRRVRPHQVVGQELGDDGITVNALAPGAITSMRNCPDRSADDDEIVRYLALKRPQKAADLVGPMPFLCSTDAAFVTGQVPTVDGGLTMH